MSRHFRRLAATIVLGAMSVTTTVGQRNPGNVRTTQNSQDLDRYISDLHKAFYPEPVAPGMVVVVVKDSRTILLKGYGYADLEAKRPVTPQSVFYIASSAKPFFGLTAAILDHKGTIDLDAPLSTYLPDARLKPPLSPAGIKLRSLLTHTHGIGEGPMNFRISFTGQGTPAELKELLATHSASKTGNDFVYGNLGYQIASLALEVALKDSWKEIVERTVMRPLGMKNTTTFKSRVNPNQLAAPYVMGSGDYTRLYYAKTDANMHAAGGIVTAGEDLAKWLEANINRGRLGGRQIFPAAVVAETHRLQADHDTVFAWVRRYGYGLGWNIGSYEGEALIHHHGGFSAFYSHISFMPKHRLGVAVLSNEVVLGDALAENVAQYIYDTLLELPGTKFKWEKRLATAPQTGQRERERLATERTRRASRQVPLLHPPETYAGVYESPEGGQMEWRVVNGQLEVSFGALWSKAEVFDAAKNELRVELQPGRGQVIAFDFSGDKAEGLTLAGMKFRKVQSVP